MPMYNVYQNFSFKDDNSLHMQPKENGEAKTDKLNNSVHGYLAFGDRILGLFYPALCSLYSC